MRNRSIIAAMNFFRFFALLMGICIVMIPVKAHSSLESAAIKERSDWANVTASSLHANRPGFLRVFFRMYLKKLSRRHLLQDNTVNADKNATASLWLGIASIVFLFIPTYTLLLVIPLGILAIVFGKHALSGGTKKELSAKVGKALGLGALITFAVLVIVALIFLANFHLN
ncbi:hypothetical protein A3860_23170 [Niastella vici]|uniref:DUF4190 domain-containing protein n=1 Tax=Niastella vici TaxID=1703345 RepID=A0A1V9FZT5_9BACT|nr:hypothetical protein [Niastella vici]OQP63842.1 hypothetical protein A3860_23170 [Niastella vici]